MAIRKIEWSAKALDQLKSALLFIHADSPANSEKVRRGIFLKLERAVQNPEFFPRDKYKINNDGSFRAFELYSYRISYRFTDASIRVLRIRHTSRKPDGH